MTTAFAPFNQTAEFKICTNAHFATDKGYVECGGRIEGRFCEFGHSVCHRDENGDTYHCSCAGCRQMDEWAAEAEWKAEQANERFWENRGGDRYWAEVNEDLIRCGEAGL